MLGDGVLYWITGLSGAGKTTIGNRLYYEIKEKKDNVILLDGDILKTIVSDAVGYSKDERHKRAMQYAKICNMLTKQDMIVICCTIAMFDDVRKWNRENNKRYVEVFLDVSEEVLYDRNQKGLYSNFKKGLVSNLAGGDVEVEFPKTPDLRIVNDGTETIESVVRRILEFTPEYSSDFDRDSDYWNKYYSDKKAPTTPSLFAKWVRSRVESQKNLLELGCGNGRDSLFFSSEGLNVTAIDASDDAIQTLKDENTNKNMYFICDDFVCSSAIFSGQYDYCYSRFSLHAINELQESEVIENVFKVLKEGGKFFIETRSVKDDIYGKGENVGRDSYYYQGHFRRFIRIEELCEKLTKAGFRIESSLEEKGFAPFEGEDPYIIRIVAGK